MTDPLSALASTVAIVDSVKQAIDSIANDAKVAEDSELMRSVLDAQSGFFDLQNSIHDRDLRIRELEEKIQRLSDKGQLVHNDDCYWARQGDEWDGPFCTRCSDVRVLKVRMADKGQDYDTPFIVCPECDLAVQFRPRPPQPSR